MGTTPAACESLRARQWTQLRALLEEVGVRNPFYRARLNSIAPAFASLEDFSNRCPFTTKQELAEDQAAHPPFGSNLTLPLEDYSRLHQTSGTSGRPLVWLDTPASWDWMIGNWFTIFEAAGVTRRDRICFAFSFGPFIGFWLAFEASARLGCLCLPAGGMSTSARLRFMMEHRPGVLFCTPTYALRLAEIAKEERLDLARAAVRLLIVAGEPGGSVPALRAKMESAWPGARVFDHHGMTEVGPVSYECPARAGRLHIIESSYFVECIDPATTRPVADGETGELVLTPLGRAGSPLLRYRTGDRVHWHRPPSGTTCECGRTDVALEGGILDRVDDMRIIRGVNIYPSAIDHLIRSRPGIAEYRVLVHRSGSLPELHIEIEVTPGFAPPGGVVARLEADLQTALTLRIPVRVAPEELPRFEMKSKRWIETRG